MKKVINLIVYKRVKDDLAWKLFKDHENGKQLFTMQGLDMETVFTGVFDLACHISQGNAIYEVDKIATLTLKIKHNLYLSLAKFKYRKIPYNEVCCCGASMDGHPTYDNHSPRCAKEYAITSYVNDKLKTEI